MAFSLPTLRRAAPRLTRQFFECSHHRCPPRVGRRPDLSREASPKYTIAFKSSTRRLSSAVSGRSAPETGLSSLLSSARQSSGRNAKKRKTGFFPKTSEKSVAYWLLGSATSVFGIVVFGGLTRLTESGYATPFRNGWQDTNCFKV